MQQQKESRDNKLPLNYESKLVVCIVFRRTYTLCLVVLLVGLLVSVDLRYYCYHHCVYTELFRR